MVTVKTYRFDTIKSKWDKKLDKTLDSPKTLLLCFGNLHKNSNLKVAYLNLLKDFPKSEIIGCSTAGEIKDSEYFEDSLVIGVVKFKKSNIYSLLREFQSGDDYKKLGRKVIKELNKKGKSLKSIIFFSEGININGSKLVEGMNEVLPKGVVLSGGLAGDGVDFKQTFVYSRDKILKNAVVAVGIYGETIFSRSNYKGGWSKFGIERKITSAKDNILYSLNGEPALKVYKKYLGEYSKRLPASALLFPLLIRRDKKDEPKVRTILGIDEKNQAMIFAGDIPEGGYATLMKANIERLIDAALMVSSEIEEETLPEELLCLCISCVGRHLVLRERTEEELEAVMEYLPPKSHQIGFYSYGEVSILQNGYCDLHNQTITITLVGEL